MIYNASWRSYHKKHGSKSTLPQFMVWIYFCSIFWIEINRKNILHLKGQGVVKENFLSESVINLA